MALELFSASRKSFIYDLNSTGTYGGCEPKQVKPLVVVVIMLHNDCGIHHRSWRHSPGRETGGDSGCFAISLEV